MHNKFKNGLEVFVCGYGQNNGKYYNNKLAKVLFCDPYFKDYCVKFEDGTEDWILPKYLQKAYAIEKNRKEIKENEV